VKWLLIYWIVVWGGAGGDKVATAVAVFDDKPACEAALSRLHNDGNEGGFGMCVASRSAP
jgi:hypothetical protein